MSLHVDYFKRQEELTKKYGPKAFLLMQVGSFHESYQTNEEGFDLTEISRVLNICRTRKNKKENEISVKFPYMLGVPSVSLTKHLEQLIFNGYTVAIYDQDKTPLKYNDSQMCEKCSEKFDVVKTTKRCSTKRNVNGKKVAKCNPDNICMTCWLCQKCRNKVKVERLQHILRGVYSPGTYINDTLTPDSNYMVCVYIEDEPQSNGGILMMVGLTAIDLSTGECIIHEVQSQYEDDKLALDEAIRFIAAHNPKETIVVHKTYSNLMKHGIDYSSQTMDEDQIISYLELESRNYKFIDELQYTKHSRISDQEQILQKVYDIDLSRTTVFEHLDIENHMYAIKSMTLLLEYAEQHSENIINGMGKPSFFEDNTRLILGNNAVFQLNILENKVIMAPSSNKNKRSLLDVIDYTCTAMGRRYLKKNLTTPFINTEQITRRHNHIETFLNDSILTDYIQYCLCDVMDLERLYRRMILKVIQPYDFVAMIESLQKIQLIIGKIKKNDRLESMLPTNAVRKNLNKYIKLCEKTFDLELLKQCNSTDIDSNVFLTENSEEFVGSRTRINEIFKDIETYCKKLSSYIVDKNKIQNGKDDKVRYTINQQEGIYLYATVKRVESLKKAIKTKKLKLKLSGGVGSLVLKDIIFTKKKSMTKMTFEGLTNLNSELNELKTYLMETSKQLFNTKLEEMAYTYGNVIRSVIKFVSEVDFIFSATEAAKRNKYCKPEIIEPKMNNERSFVDCIGLRHAIVEKLNDKIEYVAHDIKLGQSEKNEKNYIDGMLLYGLNGGGKSCCMKAVGLSVVMAQCGMFVPAKQFRLSPYKSLFARITGNDNILKGLSSFELEMTELRAILTRTGKNTLVIGDEICRGTEHVSGNAIVAAAIMKLAETKSSFIFATHLHKIAHLEKIKNLSNVKPYHVSVVHDKKNDCLIFDRRLKPGTGEAIYGIVVAKHIVHDNSFIKMANEFKNELMGTPDGLITGKKSRYNKRLYIDECCVCNKTFRDDDYIGFLDTHHINHQKDCEMGFVKESHIRMNSRANLVALCKDCHHKTHHGELEIRGYLDTSNGRILDFNFVEKESDSDSDSEDDYVEVRKLLKSKSRKKKSKKSRKNKA